MTAYVRTDGGRSKEGFSEKKDCTVRALSIVSGTSYAAAHEFLRSKGRKSGRGFAFTTLICSKYDGKVIRALPKPHCTVGSYVKAHATGNYVIRVNGHVLAVKDGVIYDNVKLEKSIRRHVQRIFFLEAA